MRMRNVYLHYGLLIVTLMLAVVVSACGESTSPSSKREAAPTAEKRLAQLQKGADSGDAAAQYGLGWMYYDGDGVPKDAAKAAEWWQKAATQGDAPAQYGLGRMYYKGEGVPKDAAKAAEWWQKAAAQGDAAAQYGLGGMYYEGEGVPKDDAKAAEWHQKAAAQGDAVAQELLALMYNEGIGVPSDGVLAYAWLNLSAAKGNETAKRSRDSITSSLNSAQRAEAERLSTSWKPGQVLHREGESASAAGDTAPAGGALAKKGTGTAFIVSSEGHAVTNHHVVAGCKEVRVQGRSDLVQVITRDEVSDLALLKMPGETRAREIGRASCRERV